MRALGTQRQGAVANGFELAALPEIERDRDHLGAGALALGGLVEALLRFVERVDEEPVRFAEMLVDEHPFEARHGDPAALPIRLSELPGLKARVSADGTWHGVWRTIGADHRFHLGIPPPGEAATYIVVLPLDRLLELRADAVVRFWLALQGRPPGDRRHDLPAQSGVSDAAESLIRLGHIAWFQSDLLMSLYITLRSLNLGGAPVLRELTLHLARPMRDGGGELIGVMSARCFSSEASGFVNS